MTVADAARMLEVSESTVYQLCRAGRLGHHRVGLNRGVIRITEGDIEAYRRDNAGIAPEAGPSPSRRRKSSGRADGKPLKHFR